VVAVGNHLAKNLPSIQYNTQFVELRFTKFGLAGSRNAFLSYETGLSTGHIWFVDRERNRDCKGNWFLQENGQYGWDIQCSDSVTASGILSDPSTGFGQGEGKDHTGREVGFVFMPRNE
jgi:hypothetical protein